MRARFALTGNFMCAEMTASRQINKIEDIYHPMIVIGCATANEIRRAMFIRSERFDIIAAARDTALIAMTLSGRVSFCALSVFEKNLHSYQPIWIFYIYPAVLTWRNLEPPLLTERADAKSAGHRPERSLLCARQSCRRD